MQTLLQIEGTVRPSTWIDCVIFNLATVVILPNSELPKERLFCNTIYIALPCCIASLLFSATASPSTREDRASRGLTRPWREARERSTADHSRSHRATRRCVEVCSSRIKAVLYSHTSQRTEPSLFTITAELVHD